MTAENSNQRRSPVRLHAGSSHDAFHIPSLDGLRAVAILIVFSSHAGLDKLVPGGFGVTLFFFLSGYLITTLLRREFESTGGISLSEFYIRRIFRIWPPFYFVLLVGFAVTAAGLYHTRLEPSPVLAQIAHFANYYVVDYGKEYPAPPGVTPGSWLLWSLAVEEHFYLLFPLLYLSLLKRGVAPLRQMQIFIGLCVGVLAWRCVLVYVLDAPSVRTYFATDTRIDSILFGCALGVFGNPLYAPRDGKSGERLLKYALLPACIAVLLATFLLRSPHFRETLRYTLQSAALFPLFIAAVRFPEWFLFRPLNWNWMRYLGTLSYSFYLIHLTIIITVGYLFKTLHPAALAVLALSLSILGSHFIHVAVELPFGRLRRRLLARHAGAGRERSSGGNEAERRKWAALLGG